MLKRLFAQLDLWGDEINPLIVWKLRRVWIGIASVAILVVLAVGLLVFGKFYLNVPWNEMSPGLEIACWFVSAALGVGSACCCNLYSDLMQLRTKDEMFKLHGLSPLEQFHGNIVLPAILLALFWLGGLPIIVFFACLGFSFWYLFLALTIPTLTFATIITVLGSGEIIIRKTIWANVVYALASVPYVSFAIFGPLSAVIVLLLNTNDIETGLDMNGMGGIVIVLLLILAAAGYHFGRLQLNYNIHRPYRAAWYNIVFTATVYPTLAVIWYLLAR